MNEPTPVSGPLQGDGTPKRRWYHNGVVVALSLFLCFPIGLILMWTGKVWPLAVRVIVSAIIALMFLSSVLRDAKHDSRVSSGAVASVEQPGSSPAVQQATERPPQPPPTPAFMRESCLQLSKTFGPGSKLSDLQKDALWENFKGKPFEWSLEITEVSAGTFGGFTVQAKCSPQSPSLIQDIQIEYGRNAKSFVMQLEKGSTYKLRGTLTNTSTLFGLGADGAF